MKITDVRIYGLNESMVAAGYPMRTDVESSDIDNDIVNSNFPKAIDKLGGAKPGTGHNNFLKGIIVQFNLTFSIKAWVEAERYNWLDFVSSCSTMHCITKMNVKKQCNKYVWKNIIRQLQDTIDYYNTLEDKSTEKAKNLFLTIVYNIPTGFELTARMTTNYLQLKTIYTQRSHHKLLDWQEFCKWVEILPKSHWITGRIINNDNS